MNQNLSHTRSEPRLTWVKSSYSDGAGNNCVEVATANAVHVRDSKQNGMAGQPSLLVPASAWTAFIKTVLS